MKSKYVLLASALLISVATFAQKDQIKAAEKALKAGNAQEAITILQGAEAASAAAPDAEKAQFNFVKANAHLALATKNEDTDVNLSAAAKAFQEVLSIEIEAIPQLSEEPLFICAAVIVAVPFTNGTVKF